MSDGITLDTKRWGNALGLVSQFSKRGAEAEFRTAIRGLVGRCYSITPPATGKSGKEKVSIFDESSEQRGINAIKRDLIGGGAIGGNGGRAGIFTPLADSIIDSALDTGVYQTENVRLFTKKDGTVYGTDKARFYPDAGYDGLRAIHTDHFSNGRMSSAGSTTRDIGRWKFITRYVIRKSSFDSYLKEIAKHVGFLASGWNDAAKLAGARIPKYARGKHGPTSARLEIDGLRFHFVFENDVNFVDVVADGDLARRLQYAVEYSANDMFRRLPFIINEAAKEAGLKAA